jgi:sialate O-acetylesterase
MKITQGLYAGQVLQRDPKQQGSARLHGTCAVDGPVVARISAARGVIRGQTWRNVGRAEKRRFAATLEGLPSGGPYTIELRIGESQGNGSDEVRARESVTVEDVYVGDVWFLAGQSNMQGVGNMQDAPRPHPLVRAFYMRDEWGLAAEPLHWLAEAVDSVHNGGVRQTRAQAERARKVALKGVCPGVYFGREMVMRTKVPQGLVLCAHGGTSMAQWSPELKSEGGGSLYGAMLRRFQLLGQPAAGILWYQGESDANEVAAAVYTERMQELVASTRQDFGQPNLPWITVQIGRVLGANWPPGPWNGIQEQQRRLPECIPHLDVVPTIDLELDDSIHISGRAYATLGERMARAADRLVLGNRKEKPGLPVESIRTYTGNPTGSRGKGGKSAAVATTAPSAIEVKIRNVVGKLESNGRPVGFSAVDCNGAAVPLIYKTRLEGSSVILEAIVESGALEAYYFSYGHGLDPNCNVVDSRGMAIPVFGPLELSGKGGTAFIKSWQVSGPRQVRGGVRKASWPAGELTREGWQAPHSDQGHLIMPQDVHDAQPGIFYLRSNVTAADEIETILAVGADGPFQTWLNGRQVGVEPGATNPCSADQYRYPVKLKQGDNELVIAFDGRSGQGWGIAARFLPFTEDAVILEGAIQF